MAYETIEDHTQMKPGDLLEYRCPRFGLVTQWKIERIHLGALNVESLIAVTPITNRQAGGYGVVMVPEQMTRGLTIIRAGQ
ncbi:MAG TPA: hypothetical protein DF966_10865 [Sulfitobacter sp.]|nr:hypothetical protein [Sulfitobacter sp.]|tara:strand:+ start:4339 stop:4581 length:243 start_codon:yes stop_codon:yes gene_type:complete